MHTVPFYLTIKGNIAGRAWQF